MQKVHLLVIFAVAFLLTACSSSNKTSGISVNQQKLNGKSFHKIFIVVTTVDIQARARLESEVAAAAISAGYAAVKSLDMIPFSLKDPKVPAKEEIELKVKESGCDAILVVSLVRKGESLSYTPGTFTDANSQFLVGILSSAIRKEGGISTIPEIPAVAIRGHYSHGTDNFILQSNLYDAATEEIMCAAQPENINIASLDEISKNYSAALIAQLKKEKLLKK